MSNGDSFETAPDLDERQLARLAEIRKAREDRIMERSTTQDKRVREKQSFAIGITLDDKGEARKTEL